VTLDFCFLGTQYRYKIFITWSFRFYTYDWYFGHCPSSHAKYPQFQWIQVSAVRWKEDRETCSPSSFLLKMETDPFSELVGIYQPENMGNVQSINHVYYNTA
jgi:hypothetical protein